MAAVFVRPRRGVQPVEGAARRRPLRRPPEPAPGGVDMTVAPEAPTASASSAALLEFAALVGPEGPVCVAGGRTQWEVGGLPAAGTREVLAPAGVVSHQPAEMIVRV